MISRLPHPDANEIIESPYGFYTRLRDDAPVHYSEEIGEYLITRFDDVQAVVHDWRRFSSQTTDDNHDHFASMDPPRHDVHRSSVARLFTPRRMAELEPAIADLGQSLTASMVERGTFDIATDLAIPLPSQVITQIVGVPPRLELEFRAGALAIATASGPENVYAAMGALQQVTWKALDEGHELPSGQILDTLLRGLGSGDPDELTRKEIVGLCTNLVLAGTDTASNLITSAMVLFDRVPGLRDCLRAEPERIPDAVEEVLRLEAPVQWLRRRSVEATEIHGVEIPAGSLLRVYWGAANRDDRVFDDPDRFDLDRSGQRHLAFGYGLHFCIGAALARLEARIAISAMLRTDGLELDHAGLVRLPSSMFRGYEHVPARIR